MAPALATPAVPTHRTVRTVRTLGTLLAIYLAHVAVFGNYIADDAGISLAYARNLAAGYGPVLYPGGEAVEGYSNPLWTLLLAGGAAIRLDFGDGIALLKGLGVLFGAGALLLTALTARRAFPEDSQAVGWIAPALLALWTPFVFWSGAGLENALYAFLLVLAVLLQLREMRHPAVWGWSALALAGLALARPEGCAFFAAFLLHRIVAVRERWRLAVWIATFAAICGVYLAFRLTVFGDWLPNTYYAKIQDRELAELWRYLVTSDDPGREYLAAFILPNVLVLAAAVVGLADWRHWRENLLLAGIIGGTFLYALYVGGDFWPAGRFLTPALPVLAIAAQHGVSRLPGRAPSLRWIAAAALLGVVAVQSARSSLELRGRHHEDGLISLQGRLEQGRRIRALATALGVKDPLYLDADIGGPTLAGLRVLDLGGLTDIHIARFRYYPPFFRSYIFEERRPHFIRTHASWTRTSKITRYPEFHEQYVAITSRRDSRGLHGEFVRRDLLEGGARREPARRPPSCTQAVEDGRARRAREGARALAGWVRYYADRQLHDKLLGVFREHESAGTLPTERSILTDLYFGLLAAGERTAAERVKRAARLSAHAPVVLADAGTPVLALVASRVLQREMETPRLQLFFDVLQTPRTDYHVWLHLFPAAPAGAGKRITSQQTPSPGTSSWKPGTIAMVEKPLYREAGEYEIRGGLWDAASEAPLCRAEATDTCYLLLGTHRLAR